MWLIFILLANLFALNSMIMISEGNDAAEDADKAKWSTDVYEILYKNQNNSQQIDKLYDKLEFNTHEIYQKLNLNLKEQQQQQKLLTFLVERNNHLEQQLQELQQKTRENIVIQRRQDGSVDFNRNWNEYKSGFGNETGEFFMGLEMLHKLTNSRPYELLIVMEDWENDRRYAKYDQFIVGSEKENYILKSIGTCSGSAGDSLAYHVAQKFSSKDRDQDRSHSHCAKIRRGAWWFNDCQDSNLNGEYYKQPQTGYGMGVTWYKFKGTNYSLKFVEMILVPK